MWATRSWSLPAENALPAPVITATLVCGSAETSAQTRASSPCICSSAALYLSGRSMVMSRTPWSRRSKRSCSYSENFTDCSLQREGGGAGSAHREAAADADGLAGDEGCLVRGKERDHVGDVGRLAQPPERDRLVPAGVVDEHVDPAELLRNPFGHRLDALTVGDVGADRDRARQRVRRRLGGRLVQVSDDDGRPLRGQLAGDRLADALPAAGHDRDLVVEPAHQRLLSGPRPILAVAPN